jgi:hypothetical protein
VSVCVSVFVVVCCVAVFVVSCVVMIAGYVFGVMYPQ